MSLSLGSGIGNIADAALGLGATLGNAPDKYTTVDTLLTHNAPDVREQLISTYGDQGITGFLKMTGAVRSGGTADYVSWVEEGRRHTTFEAETEDAAGAATNGVVGVSMSINKVNGVAIGETVANFFSIGDVFMSHKTGNVFVVNLVGYATDTTTGTDTDNIIATRMDGTTHTNGDEDATGTFSLIGNIQAEGRAASSATKPFSKFGLTKRNNSYMIIDELFKVTGSQATNIGYVNVGGGDYRWYIKGEQETRARFMDKREMMMLFASKQNQNNNSNTALADLPGDAQGSEGYFSAVSARGITCTGDSTTRIFDEMATLDNIIIELDKEGAPAEYAMYLDRRTSLDIDDMLANGIATQNTAGLPGQFGAFNNSADMAVKLGFKSFTRGGYTFHKHDWKLLNDPTLAGALTAAEYRGAMIPMASYVDPKSGVSAPALEMIYKEANGVSRELEHWVTGGAVIGNRTDDSDVAKFHYRSECQLVTRAANQHVILRGA